MRIHFESNRNLFSAELTMWLIKFCMYKKIICTLITINNNKKMLLTWLKNKQFIPAKRMQIIMWEYYYSVIISENNASLLCFVLTCILAV